MENERYIKKTVGTVLVEALTETMLAMPYDPVEFLGNFLKNKND